MDHATSTARKVWSEPRLVDLDKDPDDIENGNAAITTDFTFAAGS